MSDRPWIEMPPGDESMVVVYRNAAGQAWSGSAFVAWSDADLASYQRPCSQQGGSGRHYPDADPPAGWNDATFYDADGVRWGVYPNSDLDLDAIADRVLVRSADNTDATISRRSLGAVVRMVTNSKPGAAENTLVAMKADGSTYATYNELTDEEAKPIVGLS